MVLINALDLANLRLAFAKIDANGDGTLTLEEMLAGAQELGIDPNDLEILFRRMDKDGSGEIDYTEFTDNYADFAASKLRQTFNNLDVDGDGTLTLEEMRKGIDELGITEKDLEALFRKMDADGSGSIDYSEFAEKLLLEMAGGFMGGPAPGEQKSKARFSTLGSRALQVYVISLEGLPHRQDPSGQAARRRETFAVRVRWPSATFFGEAEIQGLEAYVWGTPREHRPLHKHGAYVYVDQTICLPWVANERAAIFSVYETDLMTESLVGEVELVMIECRDGQTRRYPILGHSGAVEGFAHLRVRLPRPEDKKSNELPERPSRPRPPRHLQRGPSPWWSPFCLCSSHERGMAESC